MPLLGTVHHLSGPDMFALTRGAVCVVCDVSVGVCGVCLVVCVCVGMRCVWMWCVAHTPKITVYKYKKDVHAGVTLFAHFLKKNAAQNSYFP